MAHSSRTTTETQWGDDVQPVLRLRLTQRASELASSKPTSARSKGMLEETKKNLSEMFSKERVVADLEVNASDAATKRNKEKINAYRAKAHKHVDDTYDTAIKSLDVMSPQQQEEVVTFWGKATEFLEEIFSWLEEMFLNVVEKIRQGFKLVKDAVSSIFKTVSGWLKSIFN